MNEIFAAILSKKPERFQPEISELNDNGIQLIEGDISVTLELTKITCHHDSPTPGDPWVLIDAHWRAYSLCKQGVIEWSPKFTPGSFWKSYSNIVDMVNRYLHPGTYCPGIDCAGKLLDYVSISGFESMSSLRLITAYLDKYFSCRPVVDRAAHEVTIGSRWKNTEDLGRMIDPTGNYDVDIGDTYYKYTYKSPFGYQVSLREQQQAAHVFIDGHEAWRGAHIDSWLDSIDAYHFLRELAVKVNDLLQSDLPTALRAKLLALKKAG